MVLVTLAYYLVLCSGLELQICAKYPYMDQCYGLFSTYGPQISVSLLSFRLPLCMWIYAIAIMLFLQRDFLFLFFL